ncbi:MAG: signal recognition particle receptor subunit alpha, partial [Ktedonobacteraceae bacterium]|nr:signal recognition particle receptor subunit alpha [Ktedonobacteraceae bacterium]
MLNRFFGQRPEEDPEATRGKEREQPAAEQRFGFLSRTRQLFSRLGQTVQQTDVITDDMWDEMTESLLAADVGPSTSMGLIEDLQKRAERENL